VGVSFNINGVSRNRSMLFDIEDFIQPITEDDIETYIRLTLRILKAQNPANLRQAILNKVINLDA